MFPTRTLDYTNARARAWIALERARARLQLASCNARRRRALTVCIVRFSASWQLVTIGVLALVFLPSRPILFIQSTLTVWAAYVPLVLVLVFCAGLLIVEPRTLGMANRLTTIRFVCVAPLVVLVVYGEFIAALVVYIACLATDILDGTVARTRHQRTEFGTIMDPLADIASTAGLYGSFLAQELVPPWVFAVLIVRYLSLFAGSAALFVAVGPLRYRATRIGKIVGVLQGAAGIMILALAASGTQWQENIGVTLFPFLGIIFGSVIISHLVIAIGYLKDSAKCKILKAI